MSGGVEVLPVDREAAANVVASYRDQKNGNWQQRIRDGLCDDGEMVQAFARHRLTAPPARTYAEGDTETQWEVWEDDLMVASSTDEADARHYLAVYSQDGPVRLVKAVTVRTPCDSDGSGEAGKTGTGLTEGNSVGPQGIAHTTGDPS